jgi:uncharacterized membrane protein
MTPAAFAKLYAATVPVFFAIDLVWIGVVAKDFYRARLGELMRPDVRWGPALLFYLLYVAAVLVFAVLPGLERGSLGRAVWLGAGLGGICYATYDLTNLAIAKGFPTIVAAVDIAWGALLTAVVAGVAYRLAGWIA